MNLRPVVAALATVLVVSACSSDSDAEPAAEPTVSIPADAGDFTPEEQEVVDATARYLNADFDRGTTPVAEALDGTVTQKFLDDLVPATKEAIDDKGLKWLGDHRFSANGVSIDGDTAELTGCLDASDELLVPSDAKDAADVTESNGSGPHQSITYGLQLVDGAWLVDAPFGEDASC